MASDPKTVLAIAKMVTKDHCATTKREILHAVEKVTGKIEAIQLDTTHIKKDVVAHLSEHTGREKAQANGLNKRNSNVRLFGIIFVVVMGIGGLIWTAAKLMNQPDVSDIVKQVIAAQKNP